MSDLFIGEILILLLLLPVIMRPFFLSLQKIEGLSLVPLIALFISICVIFAFGIRISFIPVFLLVLILFLATFSRFIRFARGLTTDWFALSSIISSIIFMLLFIAVFCISIFSSPEEGRISQIKLLQEKKTENVFFNKEIIVSSLREQPSNESKQNRIVQILYIPDPLFGLGQRETAFQIFAENGWTVYEASLVQGMGYRFISLISAIFPSLGLQKKLEDVFPLERFVRMYESLLQKFDGNPLYVLAEGRGIQITQKLFETKSKLFSGIIFVQETDLLKEMAQSTFVLEGLETSLPAYSRTSSFLLIKGQEGEFLGFGEIDCDDVLAAYALGVQRDTGRKRAELFARRVSSWISFKEGL